MSVKQHLPLKSVVFKYSNIIVVNIVFIIIIIIIIIIRCFFNDSVRTITTVIYRSHVYIKYGHCEWYLSTTLLSLFL